MDWVPGFQTSSVGGVVLWNYATRALRLCTLASGILTRSWMTLADLYRMRYWLERMYIEAGDGLTGVLGFWCAVWEILARLEWGVFWQEKGEDGVTDKKMDEWGYWVLMNGNV